MSSFTNQAEITVPTSRANASPSSRVSVVEARNSWNLEDLRELWRFRELLWFLSLRDIKLRYKQTILGPGWTLFQPLATVFVFVVFLGKLGRLDTGVENYTLLVLSGVIPWNYFANASVNAANSLVGNERLVTKTYFPRILLPAANVAAATFDFFVMMSFLAVWLSIVGIPLTFNLLLLPPIIFLLTVMAFGFGTLLSALIATQRDFRYLLLFGMQLWMFATTCIYMKTEDQGPTAQFWLPWNPLYGLILNFRSSVLGEPIDWYSLGMAVWETLVVLIIGLLYFRRVENTLADTI